MEFIKRKVTPKLAQTMLDESVASGFENRPASQATVAKYASDMTKGNFHGDKTGETIKIAMVNGKKAVIDGQHRLHAIIKSGVSTDLSFAEGVDISMFKYIDGGKPRTLSDLMTIDDSPLRRYPTIYSSAGYMLYKEDHTDDPRTKPSAEDSEGWGTVLNYVRETYAETLDDIATASMHRFGPIQKMHMGPKSLLMYFTVRANEQDPDLCTKMLDYYATYGESAAPNKNFLFTARKLQWLYEQSKDAGEGRVMKAAHKDMTNSMLDALVLGWNMTREGMFYRTENRFNEAFMEQSLSGIWPGIQ